MDFSSKRMFRDSADFLPAVVDDLEFALVNEGFDFGRDDLSNGDIDLSISKGGLFKSVIGMKSALKVALKRTDRGFSVECNVGIFGQQAVPTVISMLFFWPVLITQIWGLVRQSKLDDHVIDLVEKSLADHRSKTKQEQSGGEAVVLCPKCHVRVKGSFCSACGARV